MLQPPQRPYSIASTSTQTRGGWKASSREGGSRAATTITTALFARRSSEPLLEKASLSCQQLASVAVSRDGGGSNGDGGRDGGGGRRGGGGGDDEGDGGQEDAEDGGLVLAAGGLLGAAEGMKEALQSLRLPWQKVSRCSGD